MGVGRVGVGDWVADGDYCGVGRGEFQKKVSLLKGIPL